MPLNTEHLLADPDTKTFFISDKGMATIERMFDRVREVGTTFGYDSEEYRKTSDSLHHCLKTVLTRRGFGNRMSIVTDGPLSLYCNEDDAFVFGMVFHRDRRYDDPPAGRENAQPGEWSLHS